MVLQEVRFPGMSRAYHNECIKRFLKWYLFFTLLALLALFNKRIDPFFITHSVMAGDFAMFRTVESGTHDLKIRRIYDRFKAIHYLSS